MPHNMSNRHISINLKNPCSDIKEKKHISVKESSRGDYFNASSLNTFLYIDVFFLITWATRTNL